jgi:phage terminase large subunit-like protein
VLGRCRITGKWLLWTKAWCDKGVLENRKEIAERLGDFELEGSLDQGALRMTARAFLDEADSFMAGIKEFKDCLLGGGVEAAKSGAAG